MSTNHEIVAKLIERLDLILSKCTQGRWSSRQTCHQASPTEYWVQQAPNGVRVSYCGAGEAKKFDSYVIEELHNAYPTLREHIAAQAACIVELEGEVAGATAAIRSEGFAAIGDLQDNIRQVLQCHRLNNVTAVRAVEVLAEVTEERDKLAFELGRYSRVADNPELYQVINDTNTKTLRAEIDRLKRELATAKVEKDA